MNVDFLIFGGAVVIFLAVIFAARRKQAAKQKILDAEAAEWAVSVLNPKSPNFSQEAYDQWLLDNPRIAAFINQGKV